MAAAPDTTNGASDRRTAMSLLDQIERRFRHYALPHVTIGLIVLQVVAYFAAQGEMLKAPAGAPKR